MNRLLIVDPEQDVICCFDRLFTQEDVTILSAANAEKAIEIARRENPDLILMEVRLPGPMNGFEALKKIKLLRPKQLVILMTAYGTTQTAIEAMKHGAYDYLLKPFDVNQARELVKSAIKAHHDMERVVSYQPLLSQEHYSESIIGQSPAMQVVYKRIGQVAATDAPVLITGESGTGKELVARAIYHHSHRSDKPFLAINCAAIPETLLESELFGYEKGAFTGALNRKPGKIELCDGGTLLLDEIGDMPLSTQTKLLRVLQDGTFERVGGTQTIHVNVRFIASTNRRLDEMIRDGKFREDLYYRLNVLPIHLPALRQRNDDIPMLTEYFLNKVKKQGARHDLKISAEAITRLQHFSWPGNVRELENVVKNAALMTAGSVILADDLMISRDDGAEDAPPAEHAPLSPAAAAVKLSGNFSQDIDQLLDPVYELISIMHRQGDKHKPFDEIERSLLIKALQETAGNQVRAAKLLGITRTTLRKRMEKYKIRVRSTVQRVVDS